MVNLNKTTLDAVEEFKQVLALEDALESRCCAICDHNDFKIINDTCRYGFYYPTGICQLCGNVQQVKYYTPKVLNIFYKNYYRRIYGSINPEVLFRQQKNGRGQRIYDFISPQTGCQVLEVGCGAGGILSVFKERGAEVLGLDYDVEHLNYAQKQGVNTRVGSIEVLSPHELFNIIILSHILEHVTQPIDFLKSIRKHLAKDGVLYIEVPSLEYVSEGGYGGVLRDYWQNAHFTHFTLESLRLVCCKAGLQLIKKNKLIASSWRDGNFKLQGCDGEKVSYDESLSYNTNLLNRIQKVKSKLGIFFGRQRFLFRKLLSKLFYCIRTAAYSSGSFQFIKRFFSGN